LEQSGDTTAGSAPASGTSPGPSSSSSSSPTTTPAPGQAPTSLAAALAANDGQGPDSTSTRGPIPFDRHEKILAKAREDAEATWKPYSRLRELIPSDQVERVSGFLTALDTDAAGAIETLVSSAKQNPQLWPIVQQRLAAIVAAQQEAKAETPKPTAAPTEDTMPGPDLPDGYSAQGLAKLNEWTRNKAKAEAIAELEQRFKPLLDEHEKTQQHRQMEAVKADTAKWAKTVFDDVQQLPHFKDFQAQINEDFRKQMPTLGTNPSNGDVAALLYKVYAKIVVPNAGKVASDEMLADLKTRARATTTNPNGGHKPTVTEGSKRFRDVLAENSRTR
jgi:hypothetical protein